MDEKTKYPGIALMVGSGGFAVLTLGIVSLYALLFGFAAMQPQSTSSSAPPETTELIVIIAAMIVGVLIMMVIYGLIIFGGWNLMHRRRYAFAMTGVVLSFVAGIPCSCLPINSLVFIPLGIWALVTIVDPAVKDSFSS